MNSLPRPSDFTKQRAFASSNDEIAQALLKSDLVAFALVDSGNIVAASPLLRELLGGTAPGQHIDGRSLLSIVADVDAPGVTEFCRTALNGASRTELRCHLKRADATLLPVLLSAAVVAAQGSRNLLIVVTDISPWIGDLAANDSIAEFAAFDRATNFPTRALLLDRMKIALAAARRYRRRAAVLRIELDRFKALLQSLTSEAADEVQSTLAETLRNCVRDCDTTSRLGVTEFVVLLPEVGQREDAGITAARIVEAVEALFARNEPRFRVTAHVGVALYPADGTNSERLLQSSESAMRKAQFTRDGGIALADATSAELTALKPLEFLPKYQIGVPEIDAEHRDLVARMNALADDLAGGADPKSLEYDVRAMIEMLRAHFTTEASLLGQVRHEGGSELKMHNLRFLEELHCILLHVNSQSVALAIRHLYDWLIPHLLQLDQKKVC